MFDIYMFIILLLTINFSFITIWFYNFSFWRKSSLFFIPFAASFLIYLVSIGSAALGFNSIVQLRLQYFNTWTIDHLLILLSPSLSHPHDYHSTNTN